MEIPRSSKMLKTAPGSLSSTGYLKRLMKLLPHFLITCYNRTLQAGSIYWRANTHFREISDFYLWN